MERAFLPCCPRLRVLLKRCGFPIGQLPHCDLKFVALLLLHFTCSYLLLTAFRRKMGEKSATARTPARPAPTSKKSGTVSTGKQQSILGFFSKASASSTNGPASSPLAKASSSVKQDLAARPLKESSKSNSMLGSKRAPITTPIPSSDAVEPSSSQENRDASTIKAVSCYAQIDRRHTDDW
jgi:hypothetical protein